MALFIQYYPPVLGGGGGGGGGGSITLAPFGSSPNISAASITGSVLTLEPADNTHPGGISLFNQTIGAGIKTFSSQTYGVNFISDSSNLTISNGSSTTLLSSGSHSYQLMGDGAGSVLLPDCTTFTQSGAEYWLLNNCTQSVQIKDGASNNLYLMQPGARILVTNNAIGSISGVWFISIYLPITMIAANDGLGIEGNLLATAAIITYGTMQSGYPSLGNGEFILNAITSGTVITTVANTTANYNFILPSTGAGTTGQFLTSSGGSTAMTWTTPSSTVPTNVSVTQNSDNSTFYPVFISGNTTGNYGLDVGTDLSYNPSIGLLTAIDIIATGALAGVSSIATGEIGVSTGQLSIGGITSGSTKITVSPTASTYNFILPSSGAGSAGQLLTSQGGGSTPMTWTSASSIVPTNVSVTQKSNNSTYYIPFINGNTTGNYDLDIGTNLSYNPGLNILSLTTGGTFGAGTIATSQLDIEGAGIITIQTTDGGGTTYNFNLPDTAGTTGQFLTSGGGVGGTPMTWTTPSSIVPAQSAVTAVSNNATYYGVLINNNTSANYTLDVATAFQYVPSSGLFSATVVQASGHMQSPILLMPGSSSGFISILTQAAAGTFNLNLPTTAGTSGFLLTSDGGGSGGGMTWTNPSSVGPTFYAPTQQTFKSGSGTYTAPTSPRTPLYLRIRMVGGGGGGSGSGETFFGAGSNGTSTLFGTSLLTCTYGSGAPNSGVEGGSGGTATISSPAYGTAISGAYGNAYSFITSSPSVVSSSGGSTPFGGGASATNFIISLDGVPNTGCGGPGAPNDGGGTEFIVGGGGGAGGFIDAIVPSPTSTYSYQVGNGGAGGGAGDGGGLSGGGGAKGYIEVTEYYQ